MTYKDRLRKNKFIVKAKRRYGKKYSYSLVNYINRSTKIKIICVKHGVFETTPTNHLNGFICSVCIYETKKEVQFKKEVKYKCKNSIGERVIMHYLNKNNINFIHQKKFKNCKNKKPLPFDFYLFDLNICIEFDGQQHYEPVKRFGGNKGFKQCQKHDKIKNDYCKINSIELIRISYLDFKNIHQILKTHIKRSYETDIQEKVLSNP